MPSFLPDGRRFVFARFKFNVPSFEVGSVDSADTTPVLQLPGAISPHYANGALVFAVGSRVVAQSFDPARLQLSGEPVTLADDVAWETNTGAAFAVSNTGTLVYAPLVGGGQSRLTWMDRTGRVLTSLADDADYSNLELSRDERHLAVSATTTLAATTRDIYIVDLARRVRQRLTFDASDERSAVWTPDGRQLVYNSKGLDLYRRSANFTGGDESLQTDRASKDPRDISADGQRLLYRRTGEGTSNDIWVMPLGADRTSVALLNSPFDENYASFSPDAHSIVYVSNESGRAEVYVMSLDSGGAKVQISTGGGSFPRWRRPREIVYLSLEQTLMSVAVTGSGDEFRPGPTTPLFKIDLQPGAGTPYDVTVDGRRFIVGAKVPSRMPPSFSILVTWPALLEKR